MLKSIIVTIICLSVFGVTLQPVYGLTIPPNVGTGGEVPQPGTSLVCGGLWTKLICVVKKISDVINSIKNVSSKILNWVPHSFSFGGPILSSERACVLKFTSYTRFPNPGCLVGACVPPTVVWRQTISVSLGGRAIEVGPPVPSDGKVIAFPWISKIYENHTENRKGPWALGLGFTPFPLDEINNLLKPIRIWIPPQILDIPCATIYAKLWLPLPGGFAEVCLENFRFECVPSGEIDSQGNDVYKVIRALGTSKEDVPPATLSNLKKNFPSFPWPIP